MQDIQGALYLLQAVENTGKKDLNAEKNEHEALEIIHTVAGCVTDLSYQLQTFKF